MYIKLCESSNLLDKKMKNDLLAKIPEKMFSDNQSSIANDECITQKLHTLESLGNNYIDTSNFKIDIKNEFEDTPLIKNKENNEAEKEVQTENNINEAEKEVQTENNAKEFLEPVNFIIDISGSNIV